MTAQLLPTVDSCLLVQPTPAPTPSPPTPAPSKLHNNHGTTSKHNVRHQHAPARKSLSIASGWYLDMSLGMLEELASNFPRIFGPGRVLRLGRRRRVGPTRHTLSSANNHAHRLFTQSPTTLWLRQKALFAGPHLLLSETKNKVL